tara:strand:- start:168 stop:452 length:285 start_codon:yes stop_codon:yes gene_type:complete
MIQSDTHTAIDTATAIAIPQVTDAASGCHVEITNTDSTNSVRLGGSDITFAGGGRLVAAGETWFSQTHIVGGDVLYAITDTGVTVTLDLLWVNV